MEVDQETRLMPKPSISVITVCFNANEFIGSCIASVMNQNYEHFEYIVIDGGSTDGTLDTIRSYNNKISHWISEPDQGISDAFNKGLAFASGDYVLILNSDDYLASDDVLDRVASQAEANGFPSLLYGNCDVVNRETGELEFHADADFLPSRLWRGEMPPHPSLFTHRRYFEKYGNFDLDYRMAMDFELLARGCERESIVHMPMLTAKVRSGGMSTTNLDLARKEIARALKKNGMLATPLAMIRFKGYFFIRSVARALLEYSGLYALSSRLRKRAGEQD